MKKINIEKRDVRRSTKIERSELRKSKSLVLTRGFSHCSYLDPIWNKIKFFSNGKKTILLDHRLNHHGISTIWTWNNFFTTINSFQRTKRQEKPVFVLQHKTEKQRRMEPMEQTSNKGKSPTNFIKINPKKRNQLLENESSEFYN